MVFILQFCGILREFLGGKMAILLRDRLHSTIFILITLKNFFEEKSIVVIMSAQFCTIKDGVPGIQMIPQYMYIYVFQLLTIRYIKYMYLST